MRKLLQILFGATLCAAIAAAIIYSTLPMFWEHEGEPQVYTLTWNSAAS